MALTLTKLVKTLMLNAGAESASAEMELFDGSTVEVVYYNAEKGQIALCGYDQRVKELSPGWVEIKVGG